MISYDKKLEEFNVVSIFISYYKSDQMKRRSCYDNKTYEKDYGTFA